MAEKNNETVKPGKIPVKAKALPAKQTMNFVHHQSSVNLKRLLPVIIVLIIAAALLTKFGILDQMSKKTAAYSELSEKQAQLAAISANLQDYDEVSNEYGKLSYGWMTEKETGMVSRMDVLSLLERTVAKTAVIESFAVNDNVLTLYIHGVTLEQASGIVNVLEAEDLVESATVYKANADETGEAKIFMSILLTKEAAAE